MWIKSFFCIFLFVVTSCAEDEIESRVVKTSSGPVKGYKDPKVDLFAYYGIPYATAPVGPHKYEVPLPAPLWLNTIEAVDQKIICPQMETTLIKNMTMKEDCLLANVYVPNTEERKLPVVVYVHGGAYQIGYGNFFTPKQLVSTTKVIAVTFNYRVGPYGFLCLGTKAVPGNAGLKDIVALLKWVKQNIKNFGGNPEEVTLAGYSSGASAVDLLTLSAATKDLFHRVILDSASSLGAAVVMDPIETAKKYARSVNFTNVDDIYALEEFFLNADAEMLAHGEMMDNTDVSPRFGPCVERSIEGKERVLTDAPINILKKGKFRKLPMLYGFANMEGLLRFQYFGPWRDGMNEKFSDFLPADLQFENEKEKEAVAREVKELYFGELYDVSEETILEYIAYHSDVTFVHPVLRAAKMNIEAGNKQVYLYEITFVNENMPEVPFTKVKGAPHCAQTTLVLDDKYEDEDFLSPKSKKMRAIMRELWSNFIKTGRPVAEGSSLPEWPPATAERSPHMLLKLPLELQQGPVLPKRAKFWDDIYAKHARTPVPPPTLPPRHSEL